MEKEKLISAIKEAKSGKKRNFVQSVDLIIVLKNYDIKKDGKIEEFVRLKDRGKKAKICALVGPELKDEAKKYCDTVILSNEFNKWTKPREIKKLVKSHDFFIAQADIMPQVAQVFGKYLSVHGKMPNPKARQIIPPKTPLGPLITEFKDTVRLATKKNPVLSCSIGLENMPEDVLAENAMLILEQIEHALPLGKNNIQKVIIKTTMGKPTVVK